MASNTPVQIVLGSGPISASNPLPGSLVDASGATVDFTGIPNIYKLAASTASTNHANILAAPCRVSHIFGYCAAATVIYCKLYDQVTDPTVGTDVPYWPIPIPPISVFAIDVPEGKKFATGLSIAFTTGAADNNSSAIAANDLLAFTLLYSPI